MYPFDIVPGSEDGREALNVLATDLMFYCPLRNVTKSYQVFFLFLLSTSRIFIFDEYARDIYRVR